MNVIRCKLAVGWQVVGIRGLETRLGRLLATALIGAALPLSAIGAGVAHATAAQTQTSEPKRFELVARSNGQRYRILIHVPNASAPATGYPLLLVLDGNLAFPIADAAAAIRESSGEPSAIIVGVDRATDDTTEMGVLRLRDLTSMPPTEGLPQFPGHAPITTANFGGSPEFLSFLTSQLMPLLTSRYAIDPSRRTLYGHSIAGLFALDVLLRDTGAFDRYVISSPSIWFAQRSVLKGEAAFAQRVTAQLVRPKVLISAAGLEECVPADLPAGADRAAIAKILQSARGIANARELATRLAALQGGNGYSVAFQLYDGEDHTSVIPASIGRAVTFATRPR